MNKIIKLSEHDLRIKGWSGLKKCMRYNLSCKSSNPLIVFKTIIQ